MHFFITVCIINFFILLVFSIGILMFVKTRVHAAHQENVRIAADAGDQRIQALLDELSELSAFMENDIQRKERQLRRLLDEATDKIDVLTALKDPLVSVSQVNVPVTDDMKDLDAIPADPSVELPRTSKKNLAGKYRTLVHKQKVQQKETHAVAESPVVTGAPEMALNPLSEKIYRLADEGASIVKIARAVKRPRGEVQLILNLRSLPQSSR